LPIVHTPQQCEYAVQPAPSGRHMPQNPFEHVRPQQSVLSRQPPPDPAHVHEPFVQAPVQHCDASWQVAVGQPQ
jgi:hypothetical protein